MRRSRRTVLIVVGAMVGVLALVAVGGVVFVQRTLAFGEAPTFDTTVVGGAPEGAECRQVTGAAGGVAVEILDLGADEVYLADGDDPISREEFAETSVRFPQTRNSERFLLFDSTCFYRTYSAPADCTGAGCFEIREFYDHTWVTLSGISGQACVPDPEGCEGDVVAPGYVSVTIIDKCQDLTWSGPIINVLRDGRGNEYVMHATATGEPDLDRPTLPEGWGLEVRTIDEPLELNPRGAGGHCYFPILRDDTLQSYHQFRYDGPAWSPEDLASR